MPRKLLVEWMRYASEAMALAALLSGWKCAVWGMCIHADTLELLYFLMNNKNKCMFSGFCFVQNYG